MKGRFDQASMTLGSMQQQMQEMGDEITRLHGLLNTQGRTATGQPVQALVTRSSRLLQKGRRLSTQTKRSTRKTFHFSIFFILYTYPFILSYGLPI